MRDRSPIKKMVRTTISLVSLIVIAFLTIFLALMALAGFSFAVQGLCVVIGIFTGAILAYLLTKPHSLKKPLTILLLVLWTVVLAFSMILQVPSPSGLIGFGTLFGTSVFGFTIGLVYVAFSRLLEAKR